MKTLGEFTRADALAVAKLLEQIDAVMLTDICEGTEVDPYSTWDSMLRFCREYREVEK